MKRLLIGLVLSSSLSAFSSTLDAEKRNAYAYSAKIEMGSALLKKALIDENLNVGKTEAQSFMQNCDYNELVAPILNDFVGKSVDGFLKKLRAEKAPILAFIGVGNKGIQECIFEMMHEESYPVKTGK